MKALCIAFDASDAAVSAALPQSAGMGFDIVQLTGHPVTDAGAGTVFAWGLPSLPPADYLANALEPLAKGYDRVVAVSSMQGKDGLPRLAGLLDWPMVTDVVSIVDDCTFVRPVLAGSVLATVRVAAPKFLLTFRPAGFPPAERSGSSQVDASRPEWRGTSKRAGQSIRSAGRPDLATAKVIVSGGRPLKDAETFERVIGGLADALGGGVGATRAAVDSGIAANELQVGQTGKVVAPDLYIAAGISGSTQHMAGIKDSKVIVAINNDPDAPIFESADYGLVADLFEAVPEMTRKLKG
ncbi:MAG: FAD-binding protein [Fimbriimonadaceae bacterium]|nr:FAD-binding protein [Fimbriimonadaceae bacterium]